MKNKKAAINEMIGLGIGITIIAFVIVIGIVVLGNFASSQSGCATPSINLGSGYNDSTGLCQDWSCPTGAVYNVSALGRCTNITGNLSHAESLTFNWTVTSASPSIQAQSAHYGATKLGNNTGGLLTWLPIIIPAIIGIAIIGLFIGMRKNKGY